MFITGRREDRDCEASSWTANSWLFPLTAADLRFDLITSALSPLARAPLHVLNHHPARLSTTLLPFIFTLAFPLSTVIHIYRAISFPPLVLTGWVRARVINLHSLRFAKQHHSSRKTISRLLFHWKRGQRILAKKKEATQNDNYE